MSIKIWVKGLLQWSFDRQRKENRIGDDFERAVRSLAAIGFYPSLREEELFIIQNQAKILWDDRARRRL